MDGVPVTVDSGRIAQAYDLLAPLYDRIVAPWEAPTTAQALYALAPQQGERILDVGCGPGHLLAEIAGAVGPEGRAYGLDVASGMLDRAARRVADSRGPTALLRGDACALPFSDGSLDAVTTTETLELFAAEQTAAVLAEIRRVLRPEGRLVVTSMERDGFERAPFVRAYEWVYRHVPGYDSVGCRPIYVTRALTSAGFTVERAETVRRGGFWPTTIAVARP